MRELEVGSLDQHEQEYRNPLRQFEECRLSDAGCQRDFKARTTRAQAVRAGLVRAQNGGNGSARTAGGRILGSGVNTGLDGTGLALFLATMDSPQFHEALRTVLVVTVDAARARLFWLEPSQHPRARFELREDEQTFVHPEGRMRPGELYTDSFSGGVRSPTGAHLGFDDHQNQKDLEQRKRFAHEVADGLEGIVRARNVDRLVLAASHAEHSLLVDDLEKRRLACSIRHVPLEVTRLSPTQLYQALEAHELLH